MNSNDFIAGLDPTALLNITGAQLAQLVTSATPSSDRGLVLVTQDSNGVPVLPDTTDYPRIENYLWLRLSPLSSSFTLCAWNSLQNYNMGYSNGSGQTVSTNWNPVSIGSIPAGTVQNFQLAGGITYDKLAGNIPTSALASGSTFLTTASSPAVTDIAGSFGGGFTIQPLVVTTGKIAVGGVATNNIAAGAVTLAKFDTTGGIYQLLSNSANSTPAWQTPPQVYTGLANPNAGGTNDGQLVAVNSGAAGTFKYVAANSMYTKAVVDNIAIPSSGSYSVSTAHGLGAIPQMVRVVLHCTTNDTNTAYVVGDEIELSNITNSSNQVATFSWIVNATNVVLQRYSTGTVTLLKKGTGAGTTVSLESNFVVKFYAILFS